MLRMFKVKVVEGQGHAAALFDLYVPAALPAVCVLLRIERRRERTVGCR